MGFFPTDLTDFPRASRGTCASSKISCSSRPLKALISLGKSTETQGARDHLGRNIQEWWLAIWKIMGKSRLISDYWILLMGCFDGSTILEPLELTLYGKWQDMGQCLHSCGVYPWCFTPKMICFHGGLAASNCKTLMENDLCSVTQMLKT
jgi:hypothetical protein